MENKYFTPAIEDIYVGYEYEYKTHNGVNYSKEEFDKLPWEKGIYGFNDFPYVERTMKGRMQFQTVRVPYLTKEQIEAEGWKLSYDYSHLGIDHGVDFEKGDIWKDNGQGMFLTWNPHTNIIKITTTDKGFNSDGPNHSIKFFGECKSINEFRNIVKYLRC